MSLKLVPIASGSKGNSTLILSDSTAVLLDAGISYTRLATALKTFGLTPKMLDGVVITHEHSDHISGLQRLCEECKVYVHPETERAILMRMPLKNVQDVSDYEGGFDIGDISVEPFRIPHDARYPLAYSFSSGSARCSVATDIGVPTRGVLRNIKDSEVVLLESNHDIQMLQNGNYTRALKERIMSNNGHLSNDAAARIAELCSGNSEIRTLILGHISENNNTEQLAYDTVRRRLDEIGDNYIELHIAHQRQMSEVFEIK